MTEIDNTHYTRAVTRMGDRKNVIARQSIYSDKNIKLLEQGGRVDSTLHDHLVRHKLLRPLDHDLIVEDMVSHATLIGVAEQLVLGDSALKQFAIESPLKYRLGNVINRLPLPAPIAFKLTVAREERPELFTHSLISLIIAVYIAARAEMTLDETVLVAASALFHDIGQLHIDPAILAPEHRMNDQERHHLYAHPVIAHLILNGFAEIPPEVSRAVYEHHERNDGSGYPRGLQRDQISSLGRVLAVTEIVASRFDAEGHCLACRQLDFILKMNTRRVDPELVALFQPQLDRFRHLESNSVDHSTSVGQVSACLARLNTLFKNWETVSQQLQPHSTDELEGFLTAQLETLTTTLSYAGLNLVNLEELLAQCDDDDELLQEFLTALQEVRWQLTGVWNEVARRWPKRLEAIAGSELAIWLEQLRSI